MNILAIETTGAAASVAIINEREEVFEETSEQKLNHLQNLMPMVDQLLSKCGLLIDDLSYIAVSEGPGSFTGIRIGVSSARALAQALGLKTISVPTLKSFAYHVPEEKGIICPIFDARRGQVYGGAYRWNENGICSEVVQGAAYELKELLENLTEKLMKTDKKTVTFFGDGIAPYQAQIKEWQDLSLNDDIHVLLAPDDSRLQKASSIAKLAYQMYLAGEWKNFYDLKPNYMRKPEAERKLEEKS
jgi:universal bacterial protein YeaZ